MPRRHPRPSAPGGAPRLRPAFLAAAALLLLVLASPAGGPVMAADPVTPPPGLSMAGHVLIDGHVRTGAWFAIAVDLENTGPAITGELRIAGGAASRTRFATPVELATGSRKRYVLYAQPPTFGGNVDVTLASTDGRPVAEAQVAIAVHDPSQLVVGVVAENPGRLVGQLDLLPSPTGANPVVVPLTPEDLPERLEAWAVLDRLVWQDVDSGQLTPGQLAALRGWIAGGGRLVIAAGTGGPDVLSAIPDDLLPYRPSSVLDVDPASLRGLLGGLPAGATTLAALAGDEGRGRVLATSGDRVIAADMTFGAGTVALLGFDPATAWIAEGDRYDTPLWRRYLTPRAGTGIGLADDGNILSAVSSLPALALPPIGGIVVLLIGYIVLVGPVNYAVLRWLDRREWAWVTVPALIVAFTTASFGMGAVVRGSSVIVNEVAIVRGGAGTADGLAQAYLGVFSPGRGTYQVRAPGGALFASPINGDVFGTDVAGQLDVLQGDPSRIRDLTIGFGSLRAVRADTPAAVPVVTADLRLEGTRLKGTVTNGSQVTLLGPAVVLGSSAVRLPDLAPGATLPVDLALVANPFNQAQLSDRIVGAVFWNGGSGTYDEEAQRKIVRRSVIDQLTWDPTTGNQMGLASEAPVLLAWGTDPVVAVEVDGQDVRRVSNVLYAVPLAMRIQGTVTFRSDLLRATVLEVNANFFNKDPWTTSIGPGTVRVGYRPVGIEGGFTPTRVVVALGFGGDPGRLGEPGTLRPQQRCDPEAKDCRAPQDGLPDLDLLDRRTGDWVQFPHLDANSAYALEDPARWVDPATGELQVRFVNDRQEGVGFQFEVEMTGDVE